MLLLHTKDKEKMAKCFKGIGDARIKVDARTKDYSRMAWHGIDDDVA